MNKAIKKKVLVTGANGFIGSCLCGALRKKGYEVFDLGQADVRDFEAVLKILKRCNPESVFHLAAVIDSENNKDYFEVNAGGILNLLEACRQAGIKNFIYSSTMMVYGKPQYLPVDERHPIYPETFYGLTKRIGERIIEFYAKNYNINAVILRYSGVFGPEKKEGAVANFVESALSNKPLKILNNIAWDIIYVDDVVSANIKVLQKQLEFEIINIGSGKEINIKELAEKIVKLTKSKSKIIMPKNSLPIPRFYFNIKKAERLLNFKPTPHDTSLKAHIAQVKLNSK